MRWIALGAAAALLLTSASAVAQGVAPGGPIGGSTAIGSGLGGVIGTGPSWPNGTNQAPQPSIPSVPPGGYASPVPSSSYPAPVPSIASVSPGLPDELDPVRRSFQLPYRAQAHGSAAVAEGGPIALVKDGDKITIDAEANEITIAMSDDELSARKKAWKAPPYKATRGTLYKYIKNVKTASEGCVTDE